jgi:hypothetical protein
VAIFIVGQKDLSVFSPRCVGNAPVSLIGHGF